MKNNVLVLMGLMVHAIAANASTVNIQPGFWESALKTTITGLPKAQSDALEKMLNQMHKPQQACVLTNDAQVLEGQIQTSGGCLGTPQILSENKAVYDLTCKTKEGQQKIHGEMNFKGESYDGWYEIRTTSGPLAHAVMKNVMTARYIRKCTSAEEAQSEAAMKK